MTTDSRWTLTVSLLWLAMVPRATADDGLAPASWPQWGGLTRDFKVAATNLDTDWPASGPDEIWRRELGDGNSGISVVGDRLYTMYRRGSDEVTIALDRATGTTVWEQSSPQALWDGFLDEYGNGPHTTPLVVGDRLFTAGIHGWLRALSRETGELIWERHLWASFATSSYEFGPAQLGYSASPVAFGDWVIAVGGGDGRAVVALDQASGRTIWESQDFSPGFASPILIEVDGDSQLVVFAADRVAGMDPQDGSLLWQHPHETPYMVNAATPLWGENNLLFVSSAYDSGGRALGLNRAGGETSVREVWASRGVEVHHQTSVWLGDVIHASSGDFGPAFLVGVDAATGEELYKMRGFAKANLLAVGGSLLILDEDGILALLQPTDGEPEVLARAQIFDSRSWTVPTLVEGIVYARDRREIVALDLRSD